MRTVRLVLAVAAFLATVAVPSSVSAERCMTPEDLSAFADVLQLLPGSNGIIMGAQLKLRGDLVPPPGTMLQREGQQVGSAKTGEVATFWWVDETTCVTPPVVVVIGQPLAPAPQQAGCLSEADLQNRFGIAREALGAQNGLLFDNGRLAGAVIRVTPDQGRELVSLGWTVHGGNPNIKSAWSPESCRPLQAGVSVAPAPSQPAAAAAQPCPSFPNSIAAAINAAGGSSGTVTTARDPQGREVVGFVLSSPVDNVFGIPPCSVVQIQGPTYTSGPLPLTRSMTLWPGPNQQPVLRLDQMSSQDLGCLTVADLEARYGIVRSAAINGLLFDGASVVGAVLRNISQDQVNELTRVGWTLQGEGSRRSAWSPAICRGR